MYAASPSESRNHTDALFIGPATAQSTVLVASAVILSILISGQAIAASKAAMPASSAALLFKAARWTRLSKKLPPRCGAAGVRLEVVLIGFFLTEF